MQAHNKLLHADLIQLSRFLLKTKNSTNLLAGEQGVIKLGDRFV